jgi:hypothetical protein
LLEPDLTRRLVTEGTPAVAFPNAMLLGALIYGWLAVRRRRSAGSGSQ